MARHLPTAILLLISGLTTWGEVVYLDSGSVLRGTILAERSDAIEFEAIIGNGKARMTILRARIVRIGPDSETPADLVAAARRHLDAGELDLATALLDVAVRSPEALPAARLGLALVALARNEFEQALHQLRQVVILAPNDPEAWFQLGRLLARLGELEEGRKSLLRAAALAGDGPLAKPAKALAAHLANALAAPRLDAALATARTRYDPALGNNAAAAATGAICLEQLRNLTSTIPNFDGDIYVELKAPFEEARLFAAGGDELRYRQMVRVAQISFLVTSRSWDLMTNREKRALIGAWIRLIKDQHPYATTIAIVADGQQLIAEAVWWDIQNYVKIHWYRHRDARP